MQTNFKKSLLTVLVAWCSVVGLFAQDLPNNNATPVPVQDTLPNITSEIQPELIESVQDTVRLDSVKVANEPLSDIVDYEAEDYTSYNRKEQKTRLYNKAQVTYQDLKINAGQIIIDNATNTVFAKGIDSAGVYTQAPVFEQGLNVVKPDSIIFNFKTERALVYGSRTQQNDFYIKNRISKRVNDSVVFMRDVKFTTSENVDDPEYYFYARRVKFVPGKKIVTGFVNMYIADVPTPLGLPFAYFPMEKETSVSGFIPPSPGESAERGYFLQNGGYYFALGPYLDLTAVGSYYTNGSYDLRGDVNYKKRYRFNGNLSVQYQRLLAGERGLEGFSESQVYNLRWSHSQDTKSSPNSRFSASVNLGSSDFYQESLNQVNTGNFLNNSFQSSISYSKTFRGYPQVNLSLTATHSQNTRTQQINMTLPTAVVNVERVFPFAPKAGTKKGALQNINVNYQFRGDNRFTTTDSLFFTPQMFRDAELGMQHTIPISTNFKILKYFSATVSANYQESWVFKTIDQSYNPEAPNGVQRDTIRGFDAFRTYNLSASLGTTIYGRVDFGSDKKIQTIRHVMRPSISYGYTPAFDQFYDTYLRPDPNDPLATDLTFEEEFTRFQGGFFSPPGNQVSNSLGFQLSNVIEAKVRDKDSTKLEPRKITLLNNFTISSRYNFAADSLKLSPISVRGNIPVIQNKLDVNFSAGLDLYALNSANRRIDRLNINNGGSLFRLTNAAANFGYSFSSKDFEGKGKNDDPTENETFRNGGRQDDLFGTGLDITGQNLFTDDKEEDREPLRPDLYNFKIPWNIRLSYNVNYGNTRREDEITSHSIMFSGNVELGPRWTVGFSSGYDLVNPGFTFTQLRFARDLESWNMNFTWVPFSQRASWNFFIGISSSALSDIKYDKRRAPDERL
ncbi:putative LPS assembly protein LptD [Croceiramulus getboli]